MNGANIIRPNNGKNDLGEMTLNRFIYLTKRLQLTPKSLITYDREAFIGVENPSVRATFDINIASYPTENIEDIYTENRLRQITNTFFVLELKFNEIMPSWMHRIVRDFSLRLDSYSKYCSGIDAWTSRGGEVIINS